jgi:SAM-dependent methyltransferase
VEPDRASFEVSAVWADGRDAFHFFIELEDGTEDYLGCVEISYLLSLREYETRLAPLASSIAPPPAELVFLTQGTNDVAGYLGTVAPAIHHLKTILRDLGFAPEELRTILDFGCGSGRLLRGFLLDDADRRLTGADHNEVLIQWASSHFPPSVSFVRNDLHPPLPLCGESFDLVYLVSVFTHLSLQCQQAWLAEFRRILARGRPLVVTLHGLQVLDLYRRGNPDAYRKIMANGYWSGGAGTEGSNSYATFHMPDFAQNVLFKDWHIVAYLPGGRANSRHIPGSFSHTQDVWVLRRP